MKQTTNLFLVRVVASTLAMAVLLALVGAVLVWVTRTVDLDAEERQRDIGELAVSEILYDIAHNQESSTFWDEAVERIAEPGNEAWIDENLGTWMHTFYGIDELYVLDGRNTPIYAFAAGAIQSPVFFGARAALVRPFIDALRAEIADGFEPAAGSAEQSAGVRAVVFVGDRPAVLSLKPITSDSGDKPPPPEATYVHIAIQFLDGPFIAKVARSYVLDQLSVYPSGKAPSGTTRVTVGADGLGQPVEFAWMPFEPGKRLMTSISPVLMLAAALLLFGTFLLSSISYRRAVDKLESEEHIRYLSTHDALTGLLNRVAYEAEVDALVAGIGTTPSVDFAAFLFMDIDRFKQVNDIFGHQAGDLVLCEFARRAQAVIPEAARLFRVGGDEFAAVIDNSSMAEVERLCTRLIGCLDAPIEVGTRHAFVGVSIGVSFAPLHGIDRHELVRKADVALYYAKSAGRGRYSIFGAQMDDTIQTRAEIEADFRRALVDVRQFQVFYQPKFACGRTVPNAVEALARWNHPLKGMVSPALFIPVAETANLIGEFGLWVLERACREATDWPIEHLAVNVSPKQLQDVGFAADVARILAATGFPASRLELELTETALVAAGTATVANVAKLSEMGIAIAIDDFGTGSSTFERLRELSFDRIKIDQSFVRTIVESKSDAEIVRAMIALAHAKGLLTTAEGIETADQRDMLCALGCDELQGYLLGRPMPAERIGEFFADAHAA
jgi:diguanylate cyclase (GGDEF)-like protein